MDHTLITVQVCDAGNEAFQGNLSEPAAEIAGPPLLPGTVEHQRSTSPHQKAQPITDVSGPHQASSQARDQSHAEELPVDSEAKQVA